MNPTREQVIEFCEAAGLLESFSAHPGVKQAIRNAYSAGRLKGLEEAAAIAPDIAHAAREKWSHEETWKQPYAGNRLVHVGWDIAAAIYQLKEQK